MSLLRRIEVRNSDEDPKKDDEKSYRSSRRESSTRSQDHATVAYSELVKKIGQKLQAKLAPSIEASSLTQEQIANEFQAILKEEEVLISQSEQNRLLETIIANLDGFGPLDRLLADNNIRFIAVNDPKRIFVVDRGRLTRSAETFDDSQHLHETVDRLARRHGIDLRTSSPMIELRLPEASVNIILPPYADDIALTIQKHSGSLHTIQDLIGFGTLTPEVANFLRALVIARLNILIVGKSKTGVTTLLNVLSNFIPVDERVITIEKQVELRLPHENHLSLRTQVPHSSNQQRPLAVQDLLAQSLNMQPDRLILGNYLSGEVFDLVQTINRGFDGVLATVDAWHPRDALEQLLRFSRSAIDGVSDSILREQIASAIDVIVQVERLKDGTRRITRITETHKVRNDQFDCWNLFEFEQTGVEAGRIIGHIRPTGIQPKFILHRIEEAGIHLPPGTFGIGRSRASNAESNSASASQVDITRHDPSVSEEDTE